MRAQNTIVFPTHTIIFNVACSQAEIAKHINALKKVLPPNGTGNEHSSIIYNMGVGRYWSIAPNCVKGN